MDYLQKGIDAIKYFYQLNNETISKEELELLTEEWDDIYFLPSIDDILNFPSLYSLFFECDLDLWKIAGIMFIGIFQASTQKYYLLPVEYIKEYYGKSVEENYPKNSSQEFLEFAKTFWTLKLLLLKLQDVYPSKVITKLFEWLEFSISSVFFPTPGPEKIPTEIREQAEIDILNKVNYSLSIESFINGNPYLRSLNHNGCSTVLLFIIILCILIFFNF